VSTRGFVTFVIDGQEKTAYNHSDSYPDGLGMTMLEWLRERHADDATVIRARNLRVAGPQSKPSPEDIERLKGFANAGVGTQFLGDWYVLLRETQGEPALMLEAGVIEDAHEFPRNSLFAEWGYVADFDEKRFEVYQGFQRSRHGAGRFAEREPSEGYYPVALKAAWAFGSLPSDADFTAALSEPDEDE
jgi:hypothetical protein